MFDFVLVMIAGQMLGAQATIAFSAANALFLACFNKIVRTENALVQKIMITLCGMLTIWV